MRRAALILQIRLLRQFSPRRRRRRVPPRQRIPKAVQLEYFKAIRRYLDLAKETLERELFPSLPGWLVEAAAERRSDDTRMDRDFGKRVNEAIDKISKEYFDRLNVSELERVAEQFGQRTSRAQRAELDKQIRALVGVDVFASEPNLVPRIEAFTAENVALIKSVPNQYFDDIEKRTTAAMRQGLRWEELSKQLAERYEVSEARASLVARDQVGKFFGELNEVRQTALGIREYVWRTVGDERVRDEHAEREGQTFSWDDPPEDGHPGEAVLCRCFSEPVLTEVLAEL